MISVIWCGVDAGAVLMEAITELPPSLRFFAGGDNSIRGYSYESISPVDTEGSLIRCPLPGDCRT